MSSLRLIVTRLVGSTIGGKLGSRTMWYSSWNLSTALKHSRYWLITCYFFHGLLLASCIGAEWVTFSWIVKLQMNSFKAVEDWRPMMAGTGISVTQKDTLVLSLLYEQVIAMVPRCMICEPPWTVRVISECNKEPRLRSWSYTRRSQNIPPPKHLGSCLAPTC